MRYLDLESWPRRETFELYRQFDYPHFQLSASVDISAAYAARQEREASLNLSIVYVLARTANEIPAFRLRMRGKRVVEHDAVHPSFTVLLEDERLSFCTVPYEEDFQGFQDAARARIQQVRENPVLHDQPGQDDLLYMTSIPWVSFTGVIHPVHMHPADSVPRFAWGRIFEEHGRLRLPLSVQVNHALMDGLHVGQFFERVQDLADEPELLFGAEA